MKPAMLAAIRSALEHAKVAVSEAYVAETRADNAMDMARRARTAAVASGKAASDAVQALEQVLEVVALAEAEKPAEPTPRQARYDALATIVAIVRTASSAGGKPFLAHLTILAGPLAPPPGPRRTSLTMAGARLHAPCGVNGDFSYLPGPLQDWHPLVTCKRCSGIALEAFADGLRFLVQGIDGENDNPSDSEEE